MRRSLVCRRCGESWTGAQPCLACRVGDDRRRKRIERAAPYIIGVLMLFFALALAVSAR